MATIFNTDLFKEVKDGAKIQQLVDAVPNQLANIIQPVMEVNPRMMRHCTIAAGNSATNATAATLYTTPSDRDFYLCGAQLSYIKDATSTSLIMYIQATHENGNTLFFCRCAGISLNADSGQSSIDFNRPFKLKRNTTITVNSSTNVGNITVSGNVYGYIVENVNA